LCNSIWTKSTIRTLVTLPRSCRFFSRILKNQLLDAPRQEICFGVKRPYSSIVLYEDNSRVRNKICIGERQKQASKAFFCATCNNRRFIGLNILNVVRCSLLRLHFVSRNSHPEMSAVDLLYLYVRKYMKQHQPSVIKRGNVTNLLQAV